MLMHVMISCDYSCRTLPWTRLALPCSLQLSCISVHTRITGPPVRFPESLLNSSRHLTALKLQMVSIVRTVASIDNMAELLPWPACA